MFQQAENDDDECVCDFAMIRLILIFAVLVSGCTIELHPVVTDIAAGQIDGASSRVMVPDNGQSFTPQTILGMSVAENTASESATNVGAVGVRVRSSVSAFVHCYFRSGSGRINRILPVTGGTNNYLAAGQAMTVSVSPQLRRASDSGSEPESFLCLAAEEELVDRLPLELTVSDTTTSLSVGSFDRIFTLYQHSTNKNLVARSITAGFSQD